MDQQFPADQRKAFTEIKRVAEISLCTKKTKKSKKYTCKDAAEYRHQGSGAVVDRNANGAFILTAGHVCAEPEGLIEFFEKNIITNEKKQKLETSAHMRVVGYEGQVFKADIVAIGDGIDTCLLFVEHLKTKPLRRYYKELTQGQKAYNIASPAGTFIPHAVPMLDGYYIGERGENTALFTIPAVGGSSGSPVLDSTGRLIGMIHSVMRGFNHVAVSTSLEDLNEFIDDGISNYHERWYQNLLNMSRPKNPKD